MKELTSPHGHWAAGWRAPRPCQNSTIISADQQNTQGHSGSLRRRACGDGVVSLSSSARPTRTRGSDCPVSCIQNDPYILPTPSCQQATSIVALRPPRWVSTGPVAVRLAEMANERERERRLSNEFRQSLRRVKENKAHSPPLHGVLFAAAAAVDSRCFRGRGGTANHPLRHHITRLVGSTHCICNKQR